jgi:hypothetical protein
VGLSFLDLLYAVPVADIATRVANTHLHHVTPSGWTDVALALTAVTFGWIGHHKNRNLKRERWTGLDPADPSFTQPRFLQFVVEILIIVAYFALAAHPALTADARLGSPSELWEAGWLAGVFCLYLVWDVLDVRIARRAKEDDWADRATCGGIVTLWFVGVFAIFLLVAWTGRHHPPHSVVLFDVLAIVCLYLYRATQELALFERSAPE